MWVLIFLPLVYSSCPAYECNNKKNELDPGTCIYYNNNTFYLEPCTGNNNYCPPINSPGNSTCQTAPGITPQYNAWPGEVCGGNNLCAYGTCQGGICQGAGENSPCTIYDDCNPGLRCFNYHCVPQLESGQTGCLTDYDCTNNGGCDQGVCRTYFSRGGSDLIASCDAYGYSFLCSSLHCYQQVCIPPLGSKNPIPMQCISNNACESKPWDFFGQPETFSKECTCGLNSEGTSYCPLFGGDPQYTAFRKILSKWYSSTGINKCASVRRSAPDCIKLNWDTASYEAILFYELQVKIWPLIQNNDECVKSIYQSQYWAMQPNYPNYPSDDLANYISLGILSMIIFS